MPSFEQSGEVYTSLPRPAHDHSSVPVFGSKALTFSGTPRISSSWSPTVTTIGVLHEPRHSFEPANPDAPAGSLCSQTVLPFFFSTASSTWFSPGPTHRIHRSPCRIGDEALPQTCSILPTSLCHSSLPS